MAQYNPIKPAYFDDHWKPRIDFVAHFLRSAQDRWLASDTDFPSNSITAVILHVFAFDFHASEFIGYRGITPQQLAARSFDDWIAAVKSPLDECAALLPSFAAYDHSRVVRSFESTLTNAAKSWERNASDPSTDQVALDCAQFLADNRFAKLYT